MFKKYMCLVLCLLMALGTMTTTASAANLAVDGLTASYVSFTSGGSVITDLPSSSSTVTASVTVSNGSAAAAPVVFWLGKYVDDVLTDVAYKRVSIAAGAQDTSISVSLSGIQKDKVGTGDDAYDRTVIKAFVWTGDANKALAASASLPSDDGSIMYVSKDGEIWEEFDADTNEYTFKLSSDEAIPQFNFIAKNNATKIIEPDEYVEGDNVVEVISPDGVSSTYTIGVEYPVIATKNGESWADFKEDTYTYSIKLPRTELVPAFNFYQEGNGSAVITQPDKYVGGNNIVTVNRNGSVKEYTINIAYESPKVDIHTDSTVNARYIDRPFQHNRYLFTDRTNFASAQVGKNLIGLNQFMTSTRGDAVRAVFKDSTDLFSFEASEGGTFYIIYSSQRSNFVEYGWELIASNAPVLPKVKNGVIDETGTQAANWGLVPYTYVLEDAPYAVNWYQWVGALLSGDYILDNDPQQFNADGSIFQRPQGSAMANVYAYPATYQYCYAKTFEAGETVVVPTIGANADGAVMLVKWNEPTPPDPTNAKLSALTVNGEAVDDFSTSDVGGTYNVKIDDTLTEAVVAATAADTKAKVTYSPENGTVTEFPATVVVTVESSDESVTNTYTVNIEKEVIDKTDAKLASLSAKVDGADIEIADFAASDEGGSYTVKLPVGASVASVAANASAKGASVTVSPEGDVDVTNGGEITVTVKSIDGSSTNTYTVKFTVSKLYTLNQYSDNVIAQAATANAKYVVASTNDADATEFDMVEGVLLGSSSTRTLAWVINEGKGRGITWKLDAENFIPGEYTMYVKGTPLYNQGADSFFLIEGTADDSNNVTETKHAGISNDGGSAGFWGTVHHAIVYRNDGTITIPETGNVTLRITGCEGTEFVCGIILAPAGVSEDDVKAYDRSTNMIKATFSDGSTLYYDPKYAGEDIPASARFSDNSTGTLKSVTKPILTLEEGASWTPNKLQAEDAQYTAISADMIYNLATKHPIGVYENNGGYNEEEYYDTFVGGIAVDAPIAAQKGITSGVSLRYSDRNNSKFNVGSGLTEATYIRTKKQNSAIYVNWTGDDGNTIKIPTSFDNDYFKGNIADWWSFNVSSDCRVYLTNVWASIGDWVNKPDGWTKKTTKSSDEDYVDSNAGIVWYKDYKAGDKVEIPNWGWPEIWNIDGNDYTHYTSAIDYANAYMHSKGYDVNTASYDFGLNASNQATKNYPNAIFDSSIVIIRWGDFSGGSTPTPTPTPTPVASNVSFTYQVDGGSETEVSEIKNTAYANRYTVTLPWSDFDKEITFNAKAGEGVTLAAAESGDDVAAVAGNYSADFYANVSNKTYIVEATKGGETKRYTVRFELTAPEVDTTTFAFTNSDLALGTNIWYKNIPFSYDLGAYQDRQHFTLTQVGSEVKNAWLLTWQEGREDGDQTVLADYAKPSSAANTDPLYSFTAPEDGKIIVVSRTNRPIYTENGYTQVNSGTVPTVDGTGLWTRVDHELRNTNKAGVAGTTVSAMYKDTLPYDVKIDENNGEGASYYLTVQQKVLFVPEADRWNDFYDNKQVSDGENYWIRDIALYENGDIGYKPAFADTSSFYVDSPSTRYQYAYEYSFKKGDTVKVPYYTASTIDTDHALIFVAWGKRPADPKLSTLTYDIGEGAVAVDGFDANDKGTKEYDVELPSGTTSVTVAAVAAEGVELDKTSATLDLSNETSATFTATTGKGTSTYTINFTVEVLIPDPKLSTLTYDIGEGAVAVTGFNTADMGTKEYNVLLPSGTTSVTVAAEAAEGVELDKTSATLDLSSETSTTFTATTGKGTSTYTVNFAAPDLTANTIYNLTLYNTSYSYSSYPIPTEDIAAGEEIDGRTLEGTISVYDSGDTSHDALGYTAAYYVGDGITPDTESHYNQWLVENNLVPGDTLKYGDYNTKKINNDTSDYFKGATIIRRAYGETNQAIVWKYRANEAVPAGKLSSSLWEKTNVSKGSKYQPYYSGAYDGKDGNPFWFSFVVSSGATVFVTAPYGSDGLWTNAPEDWTKATSNNLKLSGTTNIYYKHYNAGETVYIPNYGMPAGVDETWLSYDPSIFVVVWDSEQPFPPEGGIEDGDGI